MLERFQRSAHGKYSCVFENGSKYDGNGRKRIFLLAARQPELQALLEDAGFDVDARRRPLDGSVPEANVAVVFRGRLLGRNQAALIHGKGIPVIEVLTAEPTTPSTRTWLRLSNRVPKSDLVQVVRSVADAD
jgi:hypothetical protein